jgi:hypothetical protein
MAGGNYLTMLLFAEFGFVILVRFLHLIDDDDHQLDQM